MGGEMTWEMNEKEFEAVTALPASDRYSYTIKKVADWEVLWSLVKRQEWTLSADNDEHELVPVWPHERFAAACATGQWESFEPQNIALSTWVEHWDPGIHRDKRLVSVFPVFAADISSVVVCSSRFREDLERELELYE
jgi:hypothetical protein